MNTETRIAHEAEARKSTNDSQNVRFFLIDPSAEEVCIAGSFNNWNPTATAMVRDGRKLWTRELVLPFGRYEYQFVIDDRWKPDRASKETVFNSFGELNSVIIVGPTIGNEKN
jgi:1,4-alpha-glucan branching enzyme